MLPHFQYCQIPEAISVNQNHWSKIKKKMIAPRIECVLPINASVRSWRWFVDTTKSKRVRQSMLFFFFFFSIGESFSGFPFFYVSQSEEINSWINDRTITNGSKDPRPSSEIGKIQGCSFRFFSLFLHIGLRVYEYECILKVQFKKY